MNGEEEGQGSHSLFSSRQVVHGPEALTRGDTVVVDPVQIGLFGIFWAKEGLGTLVLGQRLNVFRKKV